MKFSTAVTLFLAALLVITPLTCAYPYGEAVPDPFPDSHTVFGEEGEAPVIDSYSDPYGEAPAIETNSDPYEKAPAIDSYSDPEPEQELQETDWLQDAAPGDWEPAPEQNEAQQGYNNEDWGDEKYAAADWQAVDPAPDSNARGMEVDGGLEQQQQEDSTSYSDSGSDDPSNNNDKDDENPTTSAPTTSPPTTSPVVVMEHELAEEVEHELAEEVGDQQEDVDDQELDIAGGFLGGADIPVLQAHVPPDACLDTLYIIAFTADLPYARSIRYHEVNVKFNHTTRVIPLPTQPGDYTPRKGDMWKLYFGHTGDAYGLGFDGCVQLRHLRSIGIEEGSNDGWWIESIFSIICSNGTCTLASIDLHVNRWIDGNSGPEDRCFMLNTIV